MSNESELLKELKIHNKAFSKVHFQLISIFKNFSNQKTIIILFEYWALTFRLIYCAYGLDGLKAYIKSNYKDPIDFSYNYEIGRETDLVRRSKKINSKLIFKFLNFFPFSFRLPGSPNSSLFDRLRASYTSLMLRSIPIQKDKVLEKKIKHTLSLYFMECGISDKIVSEKDFNIPNVFTSKQLIQNHSKALSIRCAPVEIMHFNGNEDIFLMKNKLKVIGYQHGGGYDNFDLDLNLSFEKKLSAIFFGWGFSENNIHQSRFQKKQNIAKKNRVIWIETPKDTKLIAYYYPIAVTERTDDNVVPYIYNELKHSGIHYFNKPYNDALRSERYHGKRGEEINGNIKAEDIIIRGDLIIFDNCMHSLIYNCIENNIMFIIVSPESLQKNYTTEMKKWFSILRRNKLFFFTNENGLLSSKICELSSNYTMPTELVDYHFEKFIDI